MLYTCYIAAIRVIYLLYTCYMCYIRDICVIHALYKHYTCYIRVIYMLYTCYIRVISCYVNVLNIELHTDKLIIAASQICICNN